MFTYHPGWEQWNSLLHLNKGEIPADKLDEWVVSTYGKPVINAFNLIFKAAIHES